MLLVTAWTFFAAIMIALMFDPSVRMIPTDIIQGSSVTTSGGTPSVAVVVAGYVITAVIILISIGVVITLPYFIGKWCSRLLRRVMLAMKVSITKRQLFLTKCIFATLPLLGFMLVHFLLTPNSMTFAAMYMATVALSAGSIVAFLVQLLLARRLKIPAGKTW